MLSNSQTDVIYLRFFFKSRLFALTKHRDWIMLTDSPTGIVNVQPILEAIWLFLRLVRGTLVPRFSSSISSDNIRHLRDHLIT